MSAVAKIKDEPKAVAPTNESAAMFSMVERIMSDPNLPVERVSQAFDFYQRVQADQAQKAWFAAFVEAESEMEPVKRDAKGDKNNKYASFEALDAAMRPVYSKRGFAFTHTTESSQKPDTIIVVTCLVHKDGFERRYEIEMPCDGKGAKGNDVMTKTHAVASAFSYGKRYNIGNAFNIATYKDDDGRAAGALIGPISGKQVDELVALADGVKADKAKFCAFLEIESLSEIPANRFEDAKAFLTAKKRKAAR